jgi:hypothetical protein
MVVTGILWVIAFCAAIGNFALTAKRTMEFDTEGFGKGFTAHILLGGLLTLSGLGFVGGLVWFLVDKFA